MKQQHFLLAATRLKRNSGKDLETIGMESKFKNLVIVIYGELENNYELVVEEICEKKKGKWIKLDPTEHQENILKLIFQREIELVQEEVQHDPDNTEDFRERIYKREDTLFNDFY